MRKLIRSPLAWMVVAEFFVVAALVILAWNVIANAAKPALASPVLPPATAADEAAPAVSDLPAAGSRAARGPLPALNVSALFWRTRLAELNREQVVVEQLEWRLVHGAMDAAKHYLETIVLPSIQHAEKSQRAGADLLASSSPET